MYLRKRGKKWYYTIEYPAADGMGRKRVERVGGTTYAQAAKAYRQAMAALDNPEQDAEPAIEVMPFFLEWLEKDVEINLGPNTYDAYKGVIKWHIGARFGGYELSKLTTAEIQDWLNLLKQKGYSRSTVKTIFTVFNDGMRWAVSNRQYIEANPMANVKMPKFDIPRKKPFIFSRQQLNHIFQTFPLGHKYYAPCMIAYCTGLRVGECLALQWSHIDMENRTISVDSTLYDKTGTPVCKATPKTKSSLRTIPFNETLYKALVRHKAQQAKNRRLYGSDYRDNDFVCTRQDGCSMTSNDMRYFNMWCKKEFHNGSFHSFRHTHATMMLENNIELDYVSKRLGHSSIATTANIYDTITDKRNKEAMKKLDAIL